LDCIQNNCSRLLRISPQRLPAATTMIASTLVADERYSDSDSMTTELADQVSLPPRYRQVFSTSLPETDVFQYQALHLSSNCQTDIIRSREGQKIR
jgi:hypothetical protein